jgi:hypothetical protein
MNPDTVLKRMNELIAIFEEKGMTEEKDLFWNLHKIPRVMLGVMVIKFPLDAYDVVMKKRWLPILKDHFYKKKSPVAVVICLESGLL